MNLPVSESVSTYPMYPAGIPLLHPGYPLGAQEPACAGDLLLRLAAHQQSGVLEPAREFLQEL